MNYVPFPLWLWVALVGFDVGALYLMVAGAVWATLKKQKFATRKTCKSYRCRDNPDLYSHQCEFHDAIGARNALVACFWPVGLPVFLAYKIVFHVPMAFLADAFNAGALVSEVPGRIKEWNAVRRVKKQILKDIAKTEPHPAACPCCKSQWDAHQNAIEKVKSACTHDWLDLDSFKVCRRCAETE